MRLYRVAREEIVDAQRVQDGLARRGILATTGEAWQFWQAYSKAVSANWLTVPEGFADVDHALDQAMEYVDPELEDMPTGEEAEMREAWRLP